MPNGGSPQAGMTGAGTGGGGTAPLPEAGTAGQGGDGGSAGAPEPRPTLLWTARHESGDLSEWEGGSYGTGEQVVVSSAQARAGQYAMDFTIDTADRNDHVMRVYRSTVSQPAYYSAWFFLAEDHTPDQWWSIFDFLSAGDIEDPGTLDNLWDLNLRREPDGLYPYVYDHLTGQNSDLGTVLVPVGEWVHLEFYFAHAPPSSSELRLWVNGELALEFLGLGESPEPTLAFAIGNGSNGLTPDVSTIYVDDAAISSERLGPVELP